MKTIILTLEVSVADEDATIARAKVVREANGSDPTDLSLETAVADIVNMDGERDYLCYFVRQRDGEGNRGGWSADVAR